MESCVNGIALSEAASALQAEAPREDTLQEETYAYAVRGPTDSQETKEVARLQSELSQKMQEPQTMKPADQ